MKSFTAYINEQIKARGLESSELFESNKTYVTKDGLRWIVESDDDEVVKATCVDGKCQSKEFKKEEFTQAVDKELSAKVQEIMTQSKDASKIAQEIIQAALQNIQTGQQIIDSDDSSEAEKADAQQIIDDGHNLLASAQEMQTVITDTEEVPVELSEPVQRFHTADQNIKTGQELLSKVVNELIPPVDEVTVPQLAKQASVIAAAANMASNIQDAMQTAIDTQQKIFDDATPEARNEMMQCGNLTQQSKTEALQAVEDKVQQMKDQVKLLIDKGEDVDVINDVYANLESIHQCIRNAKTGAVVFEGGKLTQAEEADKVEVKVQSAENDEEVNQSEEQQSDDVNQSEEADKAEENKQYKDVVEAVVNQLAQDAENVQAQIAQIGQVDLSKEDAESMATQLETIAADIEAAKEIIANDGEVEEFVDAVKQIRTDIEAATAVLVPAQQQAAQQDQELSQSQDDEAQQDAQSLQSVIDTLADLEQRLEAVQTQCGIAVDEQEEQEEEQEEQEQEEQKELVKESQNDLPSEFKNAKPLNTKQLKQSYNDVAQVAGWIQSVWEKEYKSFSSKKFVEAVTETFKKVWDKYFVPSAEARKPLYDFSQTDIKDLAHYIVMFIAIDVVQNPSGQYRGHVENADADKAEAELTKLIDHAIKKSDR